MKKFFVLLVVCGLTLGCQPAAEQPAAGGADAASGTEAADHDHAEGDHDHAEEAAPTE